MEILESASGFIKYLEIFEIDIESGKSSPHKYMGIQSDWQTVYWSVSFMNGLNSSIKIV